MDTVEAIVGQAIRLALAGGVGLPVVLIIIIAAAAALVLVRKVGDFNLPPYVDPKPPPDSVWGDNVAPNDTPGSRNGDIEGG